MKLRVHCRLERLQDEWLFIICSQLHEPAVIMNIPLWLAIQCITWEEFKPKTHNEPPRKADIERYNTLQFLHMLIRQHDAQCIQIRHEVLDLASTDNREHIWRLLQEVRNRHFDYSLEACYCRAVRDA